MRTGSREESKAGLATDPQPLPLSLPGRHLLPLEHTHLSSNLHLETLWKKHVRVAERVREGLATAQPSCHQRTQTHTFMLAWTHHTEGPLLHQGGMQLWGVGKRGNKCLGMCLVQDEVCDKEVNSPLPFCPFRCTCVAKIRAEATSHGE